MQDYYARGGFIFAHRDIRFRAEIADPPVTPAVGDEAIVPLAEVPFELKMIEVFGCARMYLG